MKFKLALSDEDLVRLVALLTTAMGVINVLSAVTPSLRERMRLLEHYLPFSVTTGGHLTSALAGFALLLLSASLWRRKQLGWALTLGVLMVSIPTHLLKGLDYEEAILSALLAGLLIYLRPHFHARSDTPSVRQGVQILLAAFAFTLAYGVIGFYLLDRHFKLNFGLWESIRQTIVMFTQFYDPGLEPVTRFGRYFANSIYLVGGGTIGYALLMLLRPVLNRRVASDEERLRAWKIVKTYGLTPLARYALFDDKAFFFGSGESLISYAVEDRVALVLGDPIGPAGDFPQILAGFQEFCKENDWSIAFYQVLPDHLDAYRSAGFHEITIGQEAILALADFTLDGSVNKTLRNSYNKMTRLGYQYNVAQPPYSARMLRELNSISDEWLWSRNASELRFSLGWFNEAYLNSCPILLVRDREGFIEAFANIVPEFQAREVAVDLMRHREHIESGLMDFLFVSLFLWAREQGHATFNLGLSPLSGVGEHLGDPAVERALRYLSTLLSRFYDFRGLHSFKEKFHPVWSSRHLVYRNTGSLPAISAALLRAHLGGGLLSFLSLPKAEHQS